MMTSDCLSHQVVVETHSDGLRQQVLAFLGRRFDVVGEVRDAELEACGLERSVVFARGPLPAVRSDR